MSLDQASCDEPGHEQTLLLKRKNEVTKTSSLYRLDPFVDRGLLRVGGWLNPSSETKGQSVGSREKARRKFSSTGERAPGYRLSPNHFKKFKGMSAPDWAQKTFVLLCPISEQHLLSSFRVFVHDSYYLAILVWFVHQGCACIFVRETFTFCFPKQKRTNYR